MQSSLYAHQMMASDRLTQLQEAVNSQAENFCNSIGVLQQNAPMATFPDFDKMLANAKAEDAAPPGSKLTSSKLTNSKLTNSTVTNGTVKASVLLNGPKFNGTADLTKPDGTPISGPEPPPHRSKEDYGQMFARTISRTAKDIDTLIDSLPPTSETSMDYYNPGQDMFVTSIHRLEVENTESAAVLEETIKQGEIMLERIQVALAEIASIQLLSSQSFD